MRGEMDHALLYELVDSGYGDAAHSSQGFEGEALALETCGGGPGRQAESPPHILICPRHLSSPYALPSRFAAEHQAQVSFRLA